MEIQRSILFVLCFSLFSLALACEDPSNVGIGLVGEDLSGTPVTEALDLSGFDVQLDDGIRDNADQVLAGFVDDPIFGGIEAEGYLDFNSNPSLPTAYTNGTIEKVLLYLEPNYVYGDTLQPVTFALFEVLEEFTGTANTQDSIPPTGQELLQFSFTPTDDSIIVELPETWVADNDAQLRTLTFGDTFHGFKISPVSGNAVVGFLNTGTSFTAGNAALRGIVGADTVLYVAGKSISILSKTSEGSIAPEQVSFQNGINSNVSFNFEIDSLKNAALNRAALRLNVNNDALSSPPGFIRPAPGSLFLYGIVKDDSSRVILAEGLQSDDDAYVFVFQSNNVVFFTDPLLALYPEYRLKDFHGIIQDILYGGRNPFDRYEIRHPIARTNNDLAPLLLYNLTAVSEAPSIFLTTTPRQ